MKAILEFDLPEDHDNYMTMLQAQELKACLQDMDQDLRNKTKHVDSPKWEEVKEWFYNHLRERDIEVW